MLKSDYFRIEIHGNVQNAVKLEKLKSDYFRIEIGLGFHNRVYRLLAKIRLF